MNPGGRPQTPYLKQVCTLRRLILDFSDILFIIHTSFRKSLIFYAFSILISKITIQLVLLSKLRDKQLDNIQKLNSSNLCFIIIKSKIINKALIAKIKDGVYIYILFGPKQALLKSFQYILKSLKLQARIGLVIINECYLVK